MRIAMRWSRHLRRVGVRSLVVALPLVLGVAVAPALADTQVGQTGGDVACGGVGMFSDAGYVVPAGGGVITSLSFQETSLNAGQQLDLAVLRNEGGDNYLVVGNTGGVKTLTGTPGVDTFNVNIPVNGGEILATFVGGTSPSTLDGCVRSPTPDILNNGYYLSGDPAPGTTLQQFPTYPGYSLNVQANLVQDPPDTTPPSCALTGVVAGPPKQIQITVQDSDSGLLSVVPTESNNATVQVPPFVPGTTSPQVVTATKIDQSQGAQVALQVTDMAGNVTNCDPAILGLQRGAHKAHPLTVRHLARAESKITLLDGKPGLRRVRISVNGRSLGSVALRGGQERVVSVARAMHRGKTNTITLTPVGAPGSSATVVVSD
jgi:hypothetical protein